MNDGFGEPLAVQPAFGDGADEFRHHRPDGGGGGGGGRPPPWNPPRPSPWYPPPGRWPDPWDPWHPLPPPWVVPRPIVTPPIIVGTSAVIAPQPAVSTCAPWERNRACAPVWQPTCGCTVVGGNLFCNTYTNPCSACSAPSVDIRYNGPCG